MVMPFSRSRSIESMTRSLTSWLARKAPDCQSMASTRVVLPWSTWAMIATFRRSSRTAREVRGVFMGSTHATAPTALPALPTDVVGWALLEERLHALAMVLGLEQLTQRRRHPCTQVLPIRIEGLA